MANPPVSVRVGIVSLVDEGVRSNSPVSVFRALCCWWTKEYGPIRLCLCLGLCVVGGQRSTVQFACSRVCVRRSTK